VAHVCQNGSTPPILVRQLSNDCPADRALAGIINYNNVGENVYSSEAGDAASHRRDDRNYYATQAIIR